ncbi:MAG: Ig-like domain-containing protein [Planctomycetes bacterium]|nr:Ig-like domain-containing protein [Planctomycetota bacterium]
MARSTTVLNGEQTATPRASAVAPRATTAKAKRLALGVAVGGLSIGAVVASTAGVAEAKRPKVDPALLRAPLVLTSFVQNNRVDVKRNEPLTFKFSAVVKKGSLDSRSLRVLQQTGSGTKLSIGALIVTSNVVKFDPTRTQRNYDDSQRPDSVVTTGDNASGFASFTDYLVQIPGPPELHTLQNARGNRIIQGFSGSFRTSSTYSDLVAGQPYFIGEGGTGNLGFDPPRSGSTGLVDEDALIELEFSEPVDIDTLDPSSSVLVTRVRVSEAVPGYIRLNPNDRSGRKFQFVPSLGFGSDEVNLAGWDIQVVLNEGIRDLAGNPLKRPYTAPLFRTRYVAGKRSASIISETFANQTKMDPSTIVDGGEWNTVEKGAARGGAATTFPNQDVSYWRAPPAGVTVAFTRQNDPLVTDQTNGSSCQIRPLGSRGQFLFNPADVAESAAIVSMGWGPSSNALFGASHPEITLKLGHTSASALTADFDTNVNVGAAVQVYQGGYLIPQAKNIQPSDGVDANGVTKDPVGGVPKGYWPWPSFTTPFEWNGVNNLIFDAACQSASICQIQRGGFVPAGVPFPNRRAIATNYQGATADFTVDTVILDTRFQKRRRTTKATSLWYELASDTPQFAAPIVSPIGQSGGVFVTVEVEGAHGKPDPLKPGGFIPNTSTATGFTTDVTQIDGHRFFRFRLLMISNLNTNQTSRVTSLQVPYQF